MDKKWWVVIFIVLLVTSFLVFSNFTGNVALSINDSPAQKTQKNLWLILLEAVVVALIITFIFIMLARRNKLKRRR